MIWKTIAQQLRGDDNTARVTVALDGKEYTSTAARYDSAGNLIKQGAPTKVGRLGWTMFTNATDDLFKSTECALITFDYHTEEFTLEVFGIDKNGKMIRSKNTKSWNE
jgi:hypothetical protein